MNNQLSIINLNQPNLTDFSQVRNLKLLRAKTPWILFLDSDEKLSPALTQEINLAIQNKNYNYQLKRLDWFLGFKLNHGETAHFRSIRLLQKGTGRWHGQVHEVFHSNLPVKTLKAPLLHYRHLTISQFIDRLNYYTDLKALEESKFSLFKLIVYPPLKFIQNYFIRLGFLDGLPGLIMAFSMSLHSLWVRVKVYEKTA